MSWDVDLVCPHCGNSVVEQNYTHNVNPMIRQALEDAGDKRDWWDSLNGAGAEDGRTFLRAIVDALRANPEKYRAMNPSNGWGDYDSLVRVLNKLVDESGKREYAGMEWSVWG